MHHTPTVRVLLFLVVLFCCLELRVRKKLASSLTYETFLRGIQTPA